MATGSKRKAAPSGDDTGDGRLKKHEAIVSEPKEEINGKVKESLGVYEIRRAGAVICFGHIQNLGHTDTELKDMARNGMHLYFGGKRVKL